MDAEKKDMTACDSAEILADLRPVRDDSGYSSGEGMMHVAGCVVRVRCADFELVSILRRTNGRNHSPAPGTRCYPGK